MKEEEPFDVSKVETVSSFEEMFKKDRKRAEGFRKFKNSAYDSGLADWLSKKFPNGLASYNPIHTVLHPWLFIQYGWEHFVFAWERVFDGYDRRVIWSIDYYLDKMLPIWIEKLIEYKDGVPMCMFKDEDFIPDSPDSAMVEGAMEKRQEEWNTILQQIADGFRMHSRILNYEFEYKSEEEKEAKQIFNNAFYLFMEHYESLWD